MPGLCLALIERLRDNMNIELYFKEQNLERLKRIKTNYIIELAIINKVIKEKEERKRNKKYKQEKISIRGGKFVV